MTSIDKYFGSESIDSITQAPLSYIFDTRSVGFLDCRPDTKCVPVRVFSDHKLIRFLDCQVSQKVVREQLGASALRATCGVLRDELRAGGRSAPSPGLLRGGVGSSSRLQYQRLAVAAALRTLLVVPHFPQFPTQNGPTGYPRGPRRSAVVISRRQTPALTSRGTNQRVRAAREGLAAISGFQAHSPRAQFNIREPHRQTVGPFPALRA